jgi:hypothetical protein
MNLIDRVKNIIASPNKEWDVIAVEQPDASKIVTGYVLPLTALAAIAAFIGYGLIGFRILGFRVTGMEWGLYYALTAFIAGIASVYLTALVIDMLAPSFNSEKNFNRSLQLVAYSFTPMWIGGLLSIFPPIALIGSLFGIPKLKKTPADKHVGYFVVSLIALIVVYWILVWILHSILLNIFGLSFGFGGFNLNY